MSFWVRASRRQLFRGIALSPLSAACTLFAATIFICVIGGCNGKDKAIAKADEPQNPKYASPWDRPLGIKKGDATPQPTQAPRARTLAEMLQSSNGDAPVAAATPSDFQVADDVETKVKSGKPSTPVQAGASAPVSKDWTIVIAAYDKQKDAALAADSLAKLRGIPGLAQARLEDRGKSIAIAFGHYPGGDNPQARQDLERIRAINVGGKLAFAGAMLAPPSFQAQAGGIPEFNLSHARAQFGDKAEYTLQIGVYCRLDDTPPTDRELAEFRAAAEKAVVELRHQGETAFYYHSPRRSMVTVGMFGTKDYDLRNPNLQSPAIAQLMKKYPYNLANGTGVKRRRAGSAEPTIDPSFVVAVPK